MPGGLVHDLQIGCSKNRREIKILSKGRFFMDHHDPERRKYPRRTVDLPVALFSLDEQGRQVGFFMGQIQDASAGGIKVITSKPHDFDKGHRFLIYAMHYRESVSASAVEIRAELVWQDKVNRVLGMKVHHNMRQI